MNGEAALSVTDLRVSYGGVHAVDGLSLEVRRGSLTGLIGPNGAGKTSAIDAITAFTPSSGRVVLEGRDITRTSAHRRARLGLRRTWQSLELFDDLTVQENLEVSTGGRAARGELEPVLSLLGIEDQRRRLPTELSHGARKLVGVARSLVARPSVLALDEPAAGLDSDESQSFGRTLRSLADDGLSMLLVDHDMSLVLNVCDYIYVLEFGRLIAQGRPREVAKDPAVVAAYLGSSSHEAALVGEGGAA